MIAKLTASSTSQPKIHRPSRRLLQLAVTKYDLSSSHDLSQCLGGFGFSLLILAVGITMWLKSLGAEKRRVGACRRKRRNSSGAGDPTTLLGQIPARDGSMRLRLYQIARPLGALTATIIFTWAANADDKPATRVDDIRRLLIIAPDAFHEPLHEYCRFKQERRPVALVSLEAVLRDTPGCDDPERVKRYLFEQWKNHSGGYVLLVGDADVFPVRYMVLDRVTPAAFDYAFYPSDLYYADLARADGTFDDWNAQKDGFHAGYFGEVRGEKHKADPINFDQVDYRPDIAVGRWPVSTVAELKTIISKSVRYEREVNSGDRPGLKAAALFAVGGWVDSRGLMDQVASRLPGDWAVEKRYYADGRRNDKTQPPNEDQLVKLLNEGQRIVFHAGHGQDDAWEQCFSIRSFEKLGNADRLPVMISAGCSTAPRHAATL